MGQFEGQTFGLKFQKDTHVAQCRLICPPATCKGRFAILVELVVSYLCDFNAQTIFSVAQFFEAVIGVRLLQFRFIRMAPSFQRAHTFKGFGNSLLVHHKVQEILRQTTATMFCFSTHPTHYACVVVHLRFRSPFVGSVRQQFTNRFVIQWCSPGSFLASRLRRGHGECRHVGSVRQQSNAGVKAVQQR